MSLRAEVAADPGIVPVYWFARFTDAAASGDALMMSAARAQLSSLGFEVGVRPAGPGDAPRPRRRRAAAGPSATDR